MTLENPIFNRKYIFKWWIFHCHVSFLGCRWWELLDLHLRHFWPFVKWPLSIFINIWANHNGFSALTTSSFFHLSDHPNCTGGRSLHLYLPNWGGGARFPSAILTDVPSKTQNWTLVLPQRRFCPLGPNGVNLGRYSRITFRILYVSAKMITAMTWCWQCEGQLAEHLILKSLLRHSSQQSIVPIGKRCSKQTLKQN